MKKTMDAGEILRKKIPLKVLLCFWVLCCSLPALAQKAGSKIDINVRGASVRAVLEVLKKHDYQLAYPSAVIDACPKKVTLNMRSATPDQVLNETLKGTGLVYKIEGVLITIQSLQSSGSMVVKGTVKDDKGEILPGVTIQVKGTTIGFASNVDGEFNFDLPESDEVVLVFSFVGYKTREVKVKESQKSLFIVMEEDIQEMEEVVVNGIYTAKKNSYTGSVSTVRGEDILSVSQTNLFKALTTLVPGMRIIENNEQGSNPNHVPEILIRGTTSVATEGELGLNSPLIIVDGMETTLTALYDMDMFDIERVDVLKDASATAIYGDKAANGVIVVTRKKVDDPKLRVRYNFVPDIQFPDVSSFNLCNPMEKLILEKRAGLYDDATGVKEEDYNRKLLRVSRGVNTDWKSIPLRNTWSLAHSVMVSGRGGSVDYSVTARLGDGRGVMKGDYRRNYGIGFNFQYRHKENLTIGLRTDFAKTDTKNSPYGSFGDWVILNPYDSPYDEYGELIPYVSWEQPNPLYNVSTGSFSKAKSKSITNNLNLWWNIGKGFIISGSVSLSLSDSKSDDYQSSKHATLSGNTPLAQRGSYSVSASENTNWQAQVNVNYSHAFDKDGTVLSLNAGSNVNKAEGESYSFTGVGFKKPTMSDLNFSTSYADGKPTGKNTYNASVSFFGNMNFVFKNRYFVDVSYRTSANSTVGESNRWAPYWSLGAGWNMQNESFIKNGLPWISILRLRCSMGFVGSNNFKGNLAEILYTYKDSYITGLGAIPENLGNPNLKAQRTLSLNYGLTFTAFDSRLDVNVDAYQQISKDLLLPIGIPISTGAATVSANLGESENWGFELAISGLVIKTRDWAWRLSFNTHYTKNKLTKISNALKRQSEENMKAGGIAPKIMFKEGKSLNTIWAVKSLGINPADGREIFVKADGVTTTRVFDVKDKVGCGNNQPKFEGSSTTSLTYKNISVSAAFSYTFGAHVYNETRAAKVENINPMNNVDKRALYERWSPDNRLVAYPLLKYSDQVVVQSSRFVEKRNELYLSSVNISYDVPVNFVKKIGLKRLALGIGFQDVLRLSTVKFERGTGYPYMRGLNFSIRPTF